MPEDENSIDSHRRLHSHDKYSIRQGQATGTGGRLGGFSTIKIARLPMRLLPTNVPVERSRYCLQRHQISLSFVTLVKITDKEDHVENDIQDNSKTGRQCPSPELPLRRNVEIPR